METIELDLDEKFLFQLMLLAHEKDITLNTLVNDLLRSYMEKHDPLEGHNEQ